MPELLVCYANYSELCDLQSCLFWLLLLVALFILEVQLFAGGLIAGASGDDSSRT